MLESGKKKGMGQSDVELISLKGLNHLVWEILYIAKSWNEIVIESTN